MKESVITAELVEYLNPLNKGLIIKHADMATLGIPDLSITGGHVTQWVEVKYVDYIKPVDFNLRKIVGWQGPQFRTVASLDFHGTGAFYVIFFHQARKRIWHTFICTGVQCVNLCNTDHEINLSGHTFLWQGKNFEQVWKTLQRGRKDNDIL